MAIEFVWDNEVRVWVATNEELGLALEDESYDNLTNRVQLAIPELCSLNGISLDTPFFITTATRKVVCA